MASGSNKREKGAQHCRQLALQRDFGLKATPGRADDRSVGDRKIRQSLQKTLEKADIYKSIAKSVSGLHGLSVEVFPLTLDRFLLQIFPYFSLLHGLNDLKLTFSDLYDFLNKAGSDILF